MAAILAWIVSNLFVVLLIVAIVTAAFKLRRLPKPRWPGAAYVIWGELLLYPVGVWFILAGIGHAYFQQITAPSIGWAPSPFQDELGWIEIPLGAVAILALWRGYEFRLASTIVVVTFTWAAAAQHIEQIVCCHNLAENNAGPILWLLIRLILVVVAASSTAARRSADRSADGIKGSSPPAP